MRKTPLVLSWSGGKDSAFALHVLRSDPRFEGYEVVGLMTSVSEEYLRISHHGVREQLLEEQARAVALPLTKVYLPSGKSGPCTNEVYEQIMGRVMNDFKRSRVYTIAFGDLFLEDLRAWREKNLAGAGMSAVFPLWKRDTTALARQIYDLGFRALLSCVEGKVGPGFAGRAYDPDLLRDLPPGIDPCGEFGEFHTFVHDGPCFGEPVAVTVGEVVVREGRYYADLLPRSAGSCGDGDVAAGAAAGSCSPADIPPVGPA